MNRKTWSNVFRVALIIDSAIFVYKFALAVWLLVYGIREKMIFDGRDKENDSSTTAFTGFLKAFAWFLESGFFVIIIFFRWFANVSQYHNEKRSSASKNLLKYFGCGCCKTCCWYIVSVLHLCMDGILIFIDWTYSGWLTKVAISYLAWEMFIAFFMCAYKSYFIDDTAGQAADIPNRHDHQDAPPPYQIYANNNLPNTLRNDNQEAPPSYQFYASNVQQIN